MEPLVVILSAVLVVMLVVVIWMLSRRGHAGPAVDEQLLRRLLQETLDTGAASRPSGSVAAEPVTTEPRTDPTPAVTAGAVGRPAATPTATATGTGRSSDPTAPSAESAGRSSGPAGRPAGAPAPAAAGAGVLDGSVAGGPLPVKTTDARPRSGAHAVGRGSSIAGPGPLSPPAIADHATTVAGQVAAVADDAAGAAAVAQAEALARRSRADAERIHAEALADAERILKAAREEAAAVRAGAGAERARMAEEAAQALARDQAGLADERDRLQIVSETVAEDRKSLAAERDRIRSERADLANSRAGLAAAQEAVRAASAEAAAARAALEAKLKEAESTAVAQEAELARISGLSVEDARAQLLARQEEAVRLDAAVLIRRVESEAKATAKERARAIVADAIQRVASDQTSQSVVSVVQLPSDDIKGRIIGREGRNIRTFETVTGVNVIIDDTPEAVLLSCFDPVRREVGRLTLQMLIDDGRIHPHRIEEAHERAQEEVEALCQRAAEDALLAVGITDLHPELVALLGRLKYRTSYGQNVLGHLVESSHIARAMAAELGIDPRIPARGAFLHDIGKALTHEVQGSHAITGAEVARRHGESPEVVHCIEAHHDEVPPSTVEAVLTQAADACSGGRPGARRESLEAYVQRLEHIEAIASAKRGVEKVFAMQAGRELRVMVKPEVVDDLEAHVLAREVAKQIEEELTYPGQVRVTVIRESRATEVAR